MTNDINKFEEELRFALESHGYLFPSSPQTAARFEELHPDDDFDIPPELEHLFEGMIAKDLDSAVYRSHNLLAKVFRLQTATTEEEDYSEYISMAAREGKTIPQHILDQMEQDRSKSRNNEPES